MPTWVVIGASRGIGLELVRQLLSQDHQVIAAVRDPTTANQLWQTTANQRRPASCLIEQCDVTSERSIDVSHPWRRVTAPGTPQLPAVNRLTCSQEFVGRMQIAAQRGMKIENVVLNAGILKYPNVGASHQMLAIYTDNVDREPPKCKSTKRKDQEIVRNLQVHHLD